MTAATCRTSGYSAESIRGTDEYRQDAGVRTIGRGVRISAGGWSGYACGWRSVIGGIGLVISSLAGLCPGAHAREPVAETERFAFYSDFETNLNDALISAGVARNFERKELFSQGEEAECFDALPDSNRIAWDLAVDYYARVVSARRWNEREQYLIRADLAGFSRISEPADGAFVDIARGMRTAAAPAYRACRWRMQDQLNRRWINSVAALLETHEPGISTQLAALYRKSWPSRRAEVDVVETVSWSGANSWFPSAESSHLLVSQSNSDGFAALETVFHEASHGFMLRGDPLFDTLQTVAQRLERPAPDGLWHVLLFVTTGAVVRDVLAESANVDYTPLIHEIYTRSDWGRYEAAVGRHWPGYIDGKTSAEDAIAAIIESIAMQQH